jgi:oligopeptide transport system substrate-binding protein
MASSIPWLPLDESAIPCTYYYGFNVTKPPFDNRLVRQAFALSVDRQAINNIASGQTTAATSFTPPQVLGRDLYGQVGLPFNIGRAQELLAQAGFPNGEGLPQITLAFNTSEGHQRIADAMATVWREQLGAETVLESFDWDTYTENRMRT